MKPYVELESAFIENVIRDGSFADVSYRQYVNALVWIESLTLAAEPTMSAPVQLWRLATQYPIEFDRIRAELGAPTRASLLPAVGRQVAGQERDACTREYATQWRRVQIAADDMNIESLRHTRSEQRDDA